VATVGCSAAAPIYFARVLGPAVRREQVERRLRKSLSTDADARRRALEEVADAVGDDAGAHATAARAATSGMIGERSSRAIEPYRAAESRYRRALKLDPKRASIWSALARLYDEAHRRSIDATAADKALEAYRRSLELYPNTAEQRFAFAEFLALTGRRDEAKTNYRSALELDRTPHVDKKLSDAHRLKARESVD
jgi:tetratricopeptide (TPR) repeat protein